MTTQMNTFCLFKGRHELPANSGPICIDFDFATMKAVPTLLWDAAINQIWSGNPVNLLVTGLTPALTDFIAACNHVPQLESGIVLELSDRGSLNLLHYNRVTNSYVPQKIW